MSEDKGTDILTRRNLAKKTHEMLINLSRRDPLTKLENFRALDEFVEGEDKRIKHIEDDRRTHGKESGGLVIYLDADDLKATNVEGHDIGDDLILSVSEAASLTAKRDRDRTFRRGGDADEIIIILPGLTINEADEMIRQYRQNFDKYKKREKFNVSIAAAEYGKGRILSDTIKEVDRALTKKKDDNKKETGSSHVTSLII